MKYSCLIVDDEALALRLMEDYVLKVPELEIIGKCNNALSALQILKERSVDILLLDIQMPDLTGLELLSILKNRPAVILTTAYAEYALEGYRLDVMDYLLKPVSFERFMQAINKAIEWTRYKKEPQTSLPQNNSKFLRDHLFVKSDYKQVKILFDDILYVEGLKEYVSIYTAGKRVITLETMKQMEVLLPAGEFLRVHKSYIVSMKKVEAVNGNMLEIGKEKIPVGKSYKEMVHQALGLK